MRLPTGSGKRFLWRDDWQLFVAPRGLPPSADRLSERYWQVPWKVGFLGSAEGVSTVAEILSDYPETPLVAYMPPLPWLEEEAHQAYMEAFRELILPQTEVLVGNHRTLTDFLLPDWDNERAASPRELAVAAAEHGTRYVLVTSLPLPDQHLE